MNLIERDSWVVVEYFMGGLAIVGRFTTLTDSWVGLSEAINERGETIGPAIIPLSGVAIIRPAAPGERDHSRGF